MSDALSPAQARLWFLAQLFSTASGSAGSRFTLHDITLFDGGVETRVLAQSVEHALQQLGERHPILRSRFIAKGESAVVRYDAPSVRVEIEDLLAQPEWQRPTLDSLAFANKDRPLSLADGPLVRARLVRTSGTEHALLLAVHHIVADGRSLGILYEELARLVGGEKLPAPQRYSAPPPPRPEAEAYWRARMAPLPPPLQLFGPRDDRAIDSARQVVRFESAHIAALCTELGVDDKSVVIAGVVALLSLLTDESDVLVGAPEDPQASRVVGPFGRMVPLRVDVREQGARVSLRELVQRVHRARREADEHALSFERIVELAQVARDLGRPPLVEVLTVFPPAPVPRLAITVAGQPLAVRFGGVQRTAAYDLAFVFPPDGLVIEYDRARVSDAAIARHAEQLIALLRAPLDAPLSAAGLGDGAAPSTRAPAALPQPAHALVEAWVRATPTRDALVAPHARYDYAALDAAAEAIADRLAQAGVRRGDAIGVLLPGDADTVIALLAIWKAGAAFFALNPALPVARREQMIAAARPRVIVTRGPGKSEHRVASVDLADTAPAPARRRVSIRPHDLAYIVFTSGSTGTPKGVLVEHAGLANMTAALGAAYDVHAGDRVLQFASVSFDAYIAEASMALGRGATLVIADEEARRPGPALVTLLARERITTVTLPPSVLAMLPGSLPAMLRTVVSAGEALSAEVATRYASRGRLVNGYGPSEATVCSTVGVVLGQEQPTIGEALPGTRADVLDDELRMVPPGFRGELCVAGVHVARGYLDDPALTAERFRPDPFAAEPGARLYRTGDIVVAGDDGRIRYIGRRDHQVKLRGMRVELGDIESTLRGVEGANDALVVLRNDALCAYILGKVDVDAARARCRERLPSHMVPRDVVALDAWPLTPNGKIDRRALPLPEVVQAAVDLWGPRTPTQRAVIEIAEALLQRPLSLESDFFDLGGHSLLALRFADQLAARLTTPVSLNAIFVARTFERIAQEIDAGRASPQRTAQSPSLVALHVPDKPRRRPLFLSHPIHGYPLCYLPLVRRLEADRPVYSFQAPGLENECPPLGTIVELAARYVAELLRVQPKGPYQLGGWSSGGTIAYEMANQLLAAGREVSVLALIESTATTPEHLAEARRFVRDYPPEIIAYIYTKNLGRSAGLDLPITPETYRDLPEPQYLTQILAVMKRFRVVDDKMTIDALRPLLAVFTSTLKAFHAYETPRYKGRVVSFETATGNVEYVRPSWAMFTEQPPEVVRLEGDHFNIIYPPYVDALASALMERLQ